MADSIYRSDFSPNTLSSAAGFTNTLDGVFSIAQNGNNLNLVYTAIPEPSAYGLIALTAGIGFIRRR